MLESRLPSVPSVSPSSSKSPRRKSKVGSNPGTKSDLRESISQPRSAGLEKNAASQEMNDKVTNSPVETNNSGNSPSAAPTVAGNRISEKFNLEGNKVGHEQQQRSFIFDEFPEKLDTAGEARKVSLLSNANLERMQRVTREMTEDEDKVRSSDDKFNAASSST